MSLYHDHRPPTLKEFKGNVEVVSSLNELLNKPADKIPHSYLFHGASGCGKTTLARIIKNTLEVSDADYQEINSSEMRGIDTVREIIKNSQYKPLESNYRIYLIDECHKLTNDAQNAFLKILEDTPKHVIFILCTTDPEKLIKAIRGRCLQFQLKPLGENQMKRLLKGIVRDEKEKLESEIYDSIIESADGHPRNAIQILEQVLNTEPDKRIEVATRKVEEIFQTKELCQALLKGAKWKEISAILTGLKGQEPETIRRQVIGYCSAVLLNSDNVRAGLILEEFIEPFYNSGFPQLVLASYSVVKNG